LGERRDGLKEVRVGGKAGWIKTSQGWERGGIIKTSQGWERGWMY